MQAPLDQDYLSSVYVERERSILAHSYAYLLNSPSRFVSGRQSVMPCADAYVYICICICMFMYIICVFLCICICVCICMYVYVYVCICMYVYV